jgi:hypothetical protein
MEIFSDKNRVAPKLREPLAAGVAKQGGKTPFD